MGTSAVTESKSNLVGCCWPGKRVLSYPEPMIHSPGFTRPSRRRVRSKSSSWEMEPHPLRSRYSMAWLTMAMWPVGVDEPGQQGPPLQVDLHRVPVRQVQNLLPSAHRGDLPVLHQKPAGHLISLFTVTISPL